MLYDVTTIFLCHLTYITAQDNASLLTHWGRLTHICVGKITIIGSDNSLSPGRRQAIIWTNAGVLLIGPLGTYFSEILIEIQTFSLKKIWLKMLSVKCCPFHLGLNVLTLWVLVPCIYRTQTWLSFYPQMSRHLTVLWQQQIQCSQPSDTCFFNTLRPRQNDRHFTDNIFKCISLNENVWILLRISLKFAPKVPQAVIWTNNV